MKYLFLFFLLLFFHISIYSQKIEIPEIDFVSVNTTTSLPVIKWQFSNPSLISGYAVKRFIRSHPSVPDNTWHTVKIISDPLVMQYEDDSDIFGKAKPCDRTEIYEITAFKVNGTDTLYSLPSSVHKTIFLKLEYDYCDKSVSAVWTSYKPWNNKMKYEIYVRKTGETFYKAGETSAEDTTFIVNNIDYNSEYQIFVKALKQDNTASLSCIKQIFTQNINIPAYCRADTLSVTNNSFCRIRFSVDENADTYKYVLFKSNNPESDFSEIDEISASDTKREFNDEYFNFENVNRYFIVCRDYCGKDIFISDTISNTVLNAEAFSENPRYNSLEWKDIFSNGNYEIFRSEDENNFISTGNTNNHYFKDNLDSYFENQFSEQTTSGKFSYFLIFNNGNFISKSNISTAEQEQAYFFPNAFNPKSNNPENRIFKPKTAFISDYLLTIYGPYGEIIFETSNPDTGWDGKFKNGKLAPVSAYPYFAKFKNSSGKIIKIKGFVNLVY